MNLEQLAHFSYMAILLLYKKTYNYHLVDTHTSHTHKPRFWSCTQRRCYLKNYELALFLPNL